MKAPFTRTVDRVNANEASWDDMPRIQCRQLPAVRCQRFKTPAGCGATPRAGENRDAAGKTAATNPNANTTSGLGLSGRTAGGWVAVEQRTAYPKLRTHSGAVACRDADKKKTHLGVKSSWFRKGYEVVALTLSIAGPRSTSTRARAPPRWRGYSLITQPGKEINWASWLWAPARYSRRRV